jgi:hypothetical protein
MKWDTSVSGVWGWTQKIAEFFLLPISFAHNKMFLFQASSPMNVEFVVQYSLGSTA